MNTDQATNTTPEAVCSTAQLGPIDAETLNCWRVSYGLDRGPHELHALWHSWAPPGAVLALRAAVLEIERLRAELAAERERFRAPLLAFAADLRACVPILSEHGMAETAAEFAKGAAELEALLQGPNVGVEPAPTAPRC